MPLTQVPDSMLGLGGGGFSFRNRIINGAMMIDQRNAGASTSTQGYCVDRWAFGSSTGTLTAQRTGSVGAYSLTLTATSAVTALNVYQRIESVNVADLAGLVVTVSFIASSNAITTLPVSVGYANAVDNFSSSTLIASNNITITSTPTRYTTQFTLPANATNGIYLNIANSLSMASGNTLIISSVQLEKGTVATPFEVRPYGTELALCQRYYEFGRTLVSASVANSYQQSFLVTKRATPTLGLTIDAGTGAVISADGSSNFRPTANNNQLSAATYTASSEL